MSHHYLFHLLEVIKLPYFLKRAITAIYTGFTCMVKNASSLSEPFPYLKGIRQGDSTSTILFALAMQPFINALKLALVGEGFVLPDGNAINLTMYADDVTLFLSRLESFNTVIHTFNMVAQYAGAKLNIHKSKIFGINIDLRQKENVNALALPVQVVYDSIKILGIIFTPKLLIHHTQWQKKMDSTIVTIQNKIQELVCMTYYGRASWAKKKLWARWSFLLKVLQPSIDQIRQLNSIFSEIIWINGRHWVSPAVSASSISFGGFKAILPEERIKVLRVSMIAKLCSMDGDSDVFQVAQLILDQYAGLSLGFMLFHTVPEKGEMDSLPSIYRAAFLAWNELPTCFVPRTRQDILQLPVSSSKILLQADPPLKILASQARAMRIVTIEDLYHLKLKNTRLSTFIVKRVHEIVDHWILQPWPNGILGNHGSHCNDTPHFLIFQENSLLSIRNCSNIKFANIFRGKNEIQKSPQIPDNTWKLLITVSAPASFINHAWRFFHGCVVTPQFLFQMKLTGNMACLLCSMIPCSKDHQYRTCPVLALASETLTQFMLHLDLPPLLNQFQLYPFPNNDHKLANFLVLAFLYTVSLVTRSMISSSHKGIFSPRKYNSIFLSVITRHLKCLATKVPPADKEQRHKWSVFVHKEMLAYFRDDCLFIIDQAGFKQYDHFGF